LTGEKATDSFVEQYYDIPRNKGADK